MTSFPQSYESIKRAYKILTSTYNKLKKVDEYSYCSDTLIVQVNPEWRPIGKAVQNFIAKFLYPPQPPRTIQKIRETEKWIRGDIQCVHIKKICKEMTKVQFQESLIRPPKYVASVTKMSVLPCTPPLVPRWVEYRTKNFLIKLLR